MNVNENPSICVYRVIRILAAVFSPFATVDAFDDNEENAYL